MNFFSVIDSSITFKHDSGLIRTQVGLRVNDRIETTGVEGVLIYGPYMPAKSGRHHIRIEYKEENNSAIDFEGVFIDVASNVYGIVPRFSIKSLLKEGSVPGIFEFNFYLDIDVDALEVRIFVSAQSSFAFTSLHIENAESGSKKIEFMHQKRNRFKDFLALDQICEMIKSENFQLETYRPNPADDIIVIQTSDSARYYPMLLASGQLNRKYCDIDGLQYQAFIGNKKSKHPHHAMYNRIFMLYELIMHNFPGWVIYLDSDAFFFDTSFSFRNFLINLRRQGYVGYFHFENAPTNRDFVMEINSGAFAMDLSSHLVQSVVKAWYTFYTDYYTSEDYELAVSWNDIVDDQTSLRFILNKFRFEINDKIFYEQFQGKLVEQFGRDVGEVPGDVNIQSRIEKIISAGTRVFTIG